MVYCPLFHVDHSVSRELNKELYLEIFIKLVSI